MRILFISEIVGKAGVFVIKKILPGLVKERKIDFVAGNGNGVTGGFGMGRNHSIQLHKRGMNVITSGECVYYKQDMVNHLSRAPYLLRAANFPPGVPGRGWGVFKTPQGPLGVISLLGQYGYSRTHTRNPFILVSDIINKIKVKTPRILLNFHATSTAEKRTMAFLTAGRISVMAGTGTRVLTADGEILPQGTAIITDTGRTGSGGGIRGMEKETEHRILYTRLPERSRETWESLQFQGILVDIDQEGKSTSMEIITIPCSKEPSE